MRVNVQLIDAETGNHLWAERFDKLLADLFDMQDEIVARLAGALNAQLVAAEALMRAVEACTPDVCVIDVRMPPTFTDEGLRAALVIRDRWPDTGVLVLSQWVEDATRPS